MRHSPHTDEDALSMAFEGAVLLEERRGHGRRERFPNQLLDAGNHFNDDPDRIIREQMHFQGYLQLLREYAIQIDSIVTHYLEKTCALR